MSYEHSPSPCDDFEARLLNGATEINEWVDARNARGANHDSTIRKVTGRLANLTEECRDTAAYIQAPLLLIPSGDGSTAVGIGEVTGEIVGFLYQEFPTISKSMGRGQPRQGVVAIVASGNDDREGSASAAWDHILPREVKQATKDDFAQKGVVPVLVPIVEGTRFTRIDNPMPLNLNVSHIMAAGEAQSSPGYDYRDYVKRIEDLMQGKYILYKQADGALSSAVTRILKAMNGGCPFLREPVKAAAKYMRTPSPQHPGKYSVIEGTVTGILRKFIYAPYFPSSTHPNLIARGTVQAVIYPPEIAYLVDQGELTPKEADKRTGTIYLPLDMEHELVPLK